jgi:hypothetical protein
VRCCRDVKLVAVAIFVTVVVVVMNHCTSTVMHAIWCAVLFAQRLWRPFAAVLARQVRNGPSLTHCLPPLPFPLSLSLSLSLSHTHTLSLSLPPRPLSSLART